MIKLNPKAKWIEFRNPYAPSLGGEERWYRWGDTRVCINREDGMWHLSISCPTRYPTWDEIYTAWYDLVPGCGKRFQRRDLPAAAQRVRQHSPELFPRPSAVRRRGTCTDHSLRLYGISNNAG